MVNSKVKVKYTDACTFCVSPITIVTQPYTIHSTNVNIHNVHCVHFVRCIWFLIIRARYTRGYVRYRNFVYNIHTFICA